MQNILHLHNTCITQYNKRPFGDSYQLLQFCRPPEVVGCSVRYDENESPTPLLGQSAVTLVLMMLSHDGGKLYLPPSPLRLLRYTLPLVWDNIKKRLQVDRPRRGRWGEAASSSSSCTTAPTISRGQQN